MRGRRLVLLLLVGACVSPDASPVAATAPAGATAPATRGALVWRDVPDLDADSPGPVSVLWDHRAARARIVTGRFAGAGATPEAVARAVLGRHATLFGLDRVELAVAAVRQGRGGTYVRFEQRAGGLPVFDAMVIALVADGEVRAVQLSHRGAIDAPVPATDIGADGALAAVRARTGGGPERGAPMVRRGIAIESGVPRVVYRVTVLAARPLATWGADVDAATGAITGLRDRRVSVDGTGLVYDPNAVDATGNINLADNNDQTSAALDAARVSVTLPRLDGSGFLRGPFVDARSPVTRANSATFTYNYTRADNRFEEVMAYYHLDRAQQRIQDLGFTDVNNRVQVAIANGISEDNSFYDPGTKQVTFGSGGVDDGEDGDIILHEYGHSIHDDQVPGWGGGDESAMGEGFGDYVGSGFMASLTTAAGHPGMIAVACVGEWDATSYSSDTPPCLRRTDGQKHFPEAAEGQVHADGEMWSAALMRMRAAVGADTGDTLVLEHHFMLSTDESFETAAAALLAADETVNGGANRLPVRRALYAHGLLRAPVAASPFADVLEEMAVSVDPPRTGGIYADDLDDTQTVTYPGAQAVRVYFSQIDTELHSSCFDGACDSIYVSDVAGDLYQIINGQSAGTYSVVVPGDTVVLRLVSDFSEGRFGYHVDRIQSMYDDGIDIDASGMDISGPPNEAGEPFPDAGSGFDYGGGGGCCQGGAGGSAPLALVVLALLALPRRRRAW